MITESIFKSSSRTATAAYKMPEDTPDPSLLIPDEGNQVTTTSSTIPVEDNSELLT